MKNEYVQKIFPRYRKPLQAPKLHSDQQHKHILILAQRTKKVDVP